MNSFVIAIQRNEINYGFPPVAQLVSLVYIYEVTRILEDKYADFLLFLPSRLNCSKLPLPWA